MSDERRRVAEMLAGGMGGYTPQQSQPMVARRGAVLPVTEYYDGSSQFDMGSGLPGQIGHALDNVTSGRGAFWDAGDKAAAGDWRGAGHAAGDVALNVGLAGSVVPKPANAVGIFGGRLAKTADHSALAKAEEMAAQGVPREQIFKDTGWFKGVDGKWRFEIDDSGADWKRKLQLDGVGSAVKSASPLDPPKLGNMLNHNDLYSAYPDTKKLYVKPMNDPDASGGFYNRSVFISPRLGNDEALATGLHETQHFIQSKEGFAPGGDFSGTYRNLAGEAEARAVESRQHLTPDQRRARPPWLDYDVPEKDQIVRNR